MSVFPNIWRSLRAKLFPAHVLVIAVGVVTMAVAIIASAPTLFDRLVIAMMGPNATTNSMMSAMQQIITQAFRAAMLEALLLSAGGAILAAIATSLFVSAQIVTPLQRLLAARVVTLSQASGHVQVRLSAPRDTMRSRSRPAIERDTVMVRDPVCGMQISEADAQAVRRAGGASFYFCSAACAQQFDVEPQRYYPPLGGSSTFQAAPITMPARPSQAPAPLIAGASLLRPVTFGLLAILGLLTFYLGIISLAQGWEHAIEQLADDRWFVGAIAAGFGTQIGLFAYLRGLHTHAAAGGVAASTGTSTAAMLACCAHHLADILPIVGLSGAAIFLNAYKTPLLWLGILMNLAGIVYLLRNIYQQRQIACQTPLATRSI
jgi:YHS domain-containing protein